MANTKSLEQACILIVEDEPFMMSLLKRLLSNMAIENIHEAVDGSDALTKMENVNFDLIISDIMMKPMNGLQLLKALRVGMCAAPSNTPFIAFTGSNESSVFGTALALSCDAFISKNGDPQDLMDRIKSLLSSDRHIEGPTTYHEIKIPDIFNDSASPASKLEESSPSNGLCIAVPQIKVGDILERDFKTADGYLLFPAQTVMSDDHLSRLHDLDRLTDLPQIWIAR